MRDHPLVQLLLVFSPLSLLAFGGGQAVLTDVQHQSVEVHHWVTNPEFLGDYVLTRMAPGPTTLIVGLVGWKAYGWLGAVTAAVAIFLPSSLLVYGVAHIWERQRGAVWQGYVERGLAPIAAGMLLASSFNLMRALEGGWVAWAVALAVTGVLMFSKINPLVMIGAGATSFLAIGQVWRLL
ncbi:MAG: chromate transporter [Caulobacteraceae bacterium]